MVLTRGAVVQGTSLLLILFASIFFIGAPSRGSQVYTIQPCLSNNISIMRFNNHASIEQPSVVTSGYKEDLTQPSDERALLKFDLTPLPKGKIVTRATLNLYCIGTYRWSGEEWVMLPSLSRIITVHRLTSDWMGWSFTYWDYATYPHNPWENPGGDFAPATDSVSYEIPHQWNQWTVTKDVKAWYKGESENYGWLLKDANEGNPEGVRVEYMNWFYNLGVEYSPRLDIELSERSYRQIPAIYLLAVAAVMAVFASAVSLGYWSRGRLRP